MISDSVKAINASSLLHDLKFASKIENSKLIINAFNSKDDQLEYLGEYANE